MQKRLLNNPKVVRTPLPHNSHDAILIPPTAQTILWNTVALSCHGDSSLLTHLTIRNTATQATSPLPVSGLFFAIGHEPATALVRSQVQTDSEGYILTVPGTTQTSVRGVFAAGDVQDKRYRQAITSAGSGCMAGLEVERMLSEEEELGVGGEGEDE